VYHFCDTSIITIVSAVWKNKVYFTEDLKLEKFIAKSKAGTNYPANKAHARANFQWWTENTSPDFYWLPEGFTKRVCDIADSFMQLCAWINFGKEIIKDKEKEKKTKA